MSILIDPHTGKPLMRDPHVRRNYNSLNTGILSGGQLSINALDNTKLDIAAGTGIIVDHSTSPATVTDISWDAFTAVTITDLATAFATDIAIDINGNVVQARSFTSGQLRSLIFLGGIDHSERTKINNIFQIQIPAFDAGMSVRDLARAVGDINQSGNLISANGANLQINRSAGVIFSFGRNTANNKNDPHTITRESEIPVTFSHVFNNGSGIAEFEPITTTINPNNYDNGSGTLAAVGVNNWTIQRVLFFANSGNIFIQYGTSTYNKKSDALTALDPSNFTNLIGLRSSMVRGYIAVKQGATNLSDPAQAEFIDADKFGALESVNSGVDAAALVTTKGDLLAGISPGVLDRLGVGANGQVLTADSAQATGLNWTTPSGGGGGTSLSNKTQTKILSADHTDDTEIVELRFSNLTVGKFYMLTGQMSFALDNAAADFRVYCNIFNAGIWIGQPNLRINETNDVRIDIFNLAMCFYFEALGTTVNFMPGFCTPASPIQGRGDRAETFAQLTEKNELVETTDFT